MVIPEIEGERSGRYSSLIALRPGLGPTRLPPVLDNSRAEIYAYSRGRDGISSDVWLVTRAEWKRKLFHKFFLLES